MKKYWQILCAALMCLCGYACSNIDGLNDYNAVFSFEITDHKGTGGPIEIGEAEMDGNYIVIPVLHGIHNFPLYIKGEPKFENPIDCVVGIDFNDWVEIDLKRGGESGNEPLLDEQGNYLFEEPTFYVQALSGLPRKYTLKIDYQATSSDAEILSMVQFAERPETTVVGDLLSVQSGASDGTNTALLNVVNPVYPFSVTPVFILSDGATLEDNGETSYTFEDASTRHTLTVTALDGTQKVWSFGMTVLPVVNGNSDGVDEAMLQFTDLNGLSVEPDSSGFLVEEFDFTASAPATETTAVRQTRSVESLSARGQLLPTAGTADRQPTDTLHIYVNAFSGDPFPLSVRLNFPLSETVALVGNVQSMTFASLEETQDFWLLDTSTELARHWIVALESYESPVASVLSFSYEYTASQVSESLFGPSVPAIVMDEERTVEIDPVNRAIYLRAVEVHTPGTLGGTWSLNLTVDMQVSNGASLVNLSGFDWVGADSWKTPKTFGVRAADGTVYEWKVVIRDWTNGEPTPADGCDLLNVAVREVRPYVVKLEDEPLTIDRDNRTVTINVAEDEGGYPISVALDYTLSDYARITTQNGGRDPLVFASSEATNTVEIVSESGTNRATWTFRLRPPSKEIGTDVTSFRIESFSDTAFGAEVGSIDTEGAAINLNFTKVGSFPVTMNFRMGLSYKATSSITDVYGAGTLTFNGLEDQTFVVTAQNGDQRQWTIRVTYLPQLQDYTFEQWANSTTLLPAGVRGNPYWASANMTSPVKVTGMTETEGAPGQGKAVQLKTTSTLIGRLAAGSLFLGWFDASDPLGNMNDPTVMTWQGIPFSSSRPIRGMEVDVWYHPGNGAASDGGALTIELVRQRDASQEFEYHGRKPDGTWHPKNNADMVAHGRAVVATQSGTLDNGDTATQVVPDSQWTTIFVPLEYAGAYPDYTHLSIICSSSSQGDAFKGTAGSTMKLDNMRLVYEE